MRHHPLVLIAAFVILIPIVGYIIASFEHGGEHYYPKPSSGGSTTPLKEMEFALVNLEAVSTTTEEENPSFISCPGGEMEVTITYEEEALHSVDVRLVYEGAAPYLIKEAITGDTGMFVAGLPYTGNYKLTAQRTGYQKEEMEFRYNKATCTQEGQEEEVVEEVPPAEEEPLPEEEPPVEAPPEEEVGEGGEVSPPPEEVPEVTTSLPPAGGELESEELQPDIIRMVEDNAQSLIILLIILVVIGIAYYLRKRSIS